MKCFTHRVQNGRMVWFLLITAYNSYLEIVFSHKVSSGSVTPIHCQLLITQYNMLGMEDTLMS